jgi:hypothetical protein
LASSAFCKLNHCGQVRALPPPPREHFEKPKGSPILYAKYARKNRVRHLTALGCAVADDDPRWRQSAYGYGYNAAGRMDPPPRSLARRSV